MNPPFVRPASPGSRRIVHPGRTSAGSFFTPTYYDVTSSRTNREAIPVTRTSVERTDAPRVIPIRQRSPPRTVREDDFTVRPRRMSLNPGEPGSQRPTSTVVPRSPNRTTRPVIIKGPDRESSPLSRVPKSGGVQLEASYIIPASSASSGRHHHRHSSLTTGEQLRVLDRELRGQGYPSTNTRTTAATRQPVRDNRDYSYEYTGPRKEFERELTPLPRVRERGGSYSQRERPTSMIITDRGDAEVRRPNKDLRPPTSTRAFDNIGRSDSLRQGYRARDDDLERRDIPVKAYARDERDRGRYRDLPRPPRRASEDDYVPYPEERNRHGRPRKSTWEDERQEPRPRPRKLDEERYEPTDREHDIQYDRRGGEERTRKTQERELPREDDRRREYKESDEKDRKVRDEQRDRPRDRRNKDDDEPSKSFMTGAGVAAAAGAAGLAAEGVRRHRDKDVRDTRDNDTHGTKDSRGYLKEPERAWADGSETTSVSGDTRISGEPDGDREERRRRRRQDREREEREYQEAKEYDRRIREDDAASGIPHEARRSSQTDPSSTALVLQEQRSFERRPPGTAEDGQQSHQPRTRRHHSRTDQEDSYSDSSSGSRRSIGEEVDTIPRQPRVVSPSNEDRKPALPPAPPKGILKKGRDKFPEPPNPVREGVAPLDAARRGIPPEARWTRINRRLVNPEALEQEGVRFEEGPDYVVVLKVLNQEEITHYAQKTHEIREKRRLMMGGNMPPPPPGSGPGLGQGGEISDQS